MSSAPKTDSEQQAKASSGGPAPGDNRADDEVTATVSPAAPAVVLGDKDGFDQSEATGGSAGANNSSSGASFNPAGVEVLVGITAALSVEGDAGGNVNPVDEGGKSVVGANPIVDQSLNAELDMDTSEAAGQPGASKESTEAKPKSFQELLDERRKASEGVPTSSKQSSAAVLGEVADTASTDATIIMVPTKSDKKKIMKSKAQKKREL